jgi:hypothetical protein
MSYYWLLVGNFMKPIIIFKASLFPCLFLPDLYCSSYSIKTVCIVIWKFNPLCSVLYLP